MGRLIRVVGVAAVAVVTTSGRAVAQPDRVASFEMFWPSHRPEEIAARAHAAVEAITGQRLGRATVARPAKGATTSSGRMRVTVPQAPSLEIVYLPDYAELRIVDTELAASTAPRAEMEQDEAVKLAKGAFDRLPHNLVDPRHYDWANADVASTWVGGGSLDGKIAEKKRIEYRITLRRTINGIELANAGARIAVHVSGRVSGLRLGGVAVASKMADRVEEPTGKGRWLTRRVATNELQARFQREIVPESAKARIAWSRVMYVMPENRRSAVVEPLYVVSYSLEFPTGAGETAVSRRRTVGFSLVDPKAPPVDLTPPVRPPQIEKTRKYPTERR